MKNNTLLSIAVCVAMICTPAAITESILTDKKDKDGNAVNKPVELIIPKQYNNELITKKECDKSRKFIKLREKKGNVKLYNAAICRGNTYRSNSNVKRVQRL